MTEELNEILDDVKSLQIRGATSVAKSMVDILLKNRNNIASKSANKEDFIGEIRNIAEKLTQAKPTETMAQNILGFIIFELQDQSVKNVEDCKLTFDKMVGDIKKTIDDNENKFIKSGVEIIQSLTKKSRMLSILTHCHSSGVRNILKAANDEKIDFRVFNTETRPVFLGRATAKKMVEENISVTMIIDSAAPFVISGKGGERFRTDLVLLGSDAITLNGAAVNKIGSYGISLSAFYEKIPLYIVTSLLKVKKGVYNIFDIPLEIRPYQEVWEDAPEGLEIANFAFDIIPSEFITGFITEFGILKPGEIKDAVAKNYPRLL